MKIIISVGGKFHAFHLARQLQKRGYLERLITSYPLFKILEYGLPKKKIISLPLKEILGKIYEGIPRLSSYLDPQWYLCSIFDKQASKNIRPCDIFIGWSSFSLESLRKAKSLGAKTVVERGSSHIEYQRDILKEEYQHLGLKPKLPHPRIIEKELKEYQEADYIGVPSGFAKRTFLERGISEDKLIQVPFGVDAEVFRPIPKKDETFRVVYAGAMVIRKGVHYLLEAVSELKLGNFELLLIGSISDEIKPFFRKYRDSFKYSGHINYFKLYKYYSQGSVFVIASLEEGLALVISQAMACGLPVICTTNTGGEDIVRDGVDGFIIPIRDVKALREKILYLYNNPSICYEMGRQAQERVKNNFTWDNYGERIVNNYLNMLK